MFRPVRGGASTLVTADNVSKFPMLRLPARDARLYRIVTAMGCSSGVGLSLVFCEPTFGVQSGGAAHAGGGNRLSVHLVDYVAAGENALHRGLSSFGDDIAFIVEIDLSFEDLRVWIVSDRYEDTVDVEL